jgi:histone-lysine N-methyltransferase SETD1
MFEGQPSIFIYSIREIGQFEELTYDYQFSVDGEEKLVCTCGAKNCQGRLN